MQVKDLIRQLQQLDPDLTILMASDPEGNSYSKFSGDMSVAHAGDPNEYNIEWSSEEDWAENDHEPPYPGDNVVVLWP